MTKRAGANAGEKQVSFSQASAQRIADAVRAVEQGDRNAIGLITSPRLAGGELRLKVGKFTGSWATASWKTVTLVNSTHTAEVYNWCNHIDSSSDECCNQFVIFGKAGGTNSVLEVTMHSTCSTCHMRIGGLDLKTLPGYVQGEVQILGHNDSPCLQWYSVTTCSTTS